MICEAAFFNQNPIKPKIKQKGSPPEALKKITI